MKNKNNEELQDLVKKATRIKTLEHNIGAGHFQFLRQKLLLHILGQIRHILDISVFYIVSVIFKAGRKTGKHVLFVTFQVINYAIQNHRINPMQLDYVTATEIPVQTMRDVKNAMEEIDDLSQDFSFCKPYQSPQRTRHLIQEFLDSTQLSVIRNS